MCHPLAIRVATNAVEDSLMLAGHMIYRLVRLQYVRKLRYDTVYNVLLMLQYNVAA